MIDVKDFLGKEHCKESLRRKIHKYRIMLFKDSKQVNVSSSDILSFRILTRECLDVYERNGASRIKLSPLIRKDKTLVD